MNEQELVKNEQKIGKIEQEIFKHLKDKIKNAYSKEAEETIETEVKNRNYLLEDWQIWAAVQRIKEMADKANLEVNKPKKIKLMSILLIIFSMAVSFVVLMVSLSVDMPSALRGGLMLASFTGIVYPIKMWWSSITSKG